VTIHSLKGYRFDSCGLVYKKTMPYGCAPLQRIQQGQKGQKGEGGFDFVEKCSKPPIPMPPEVLKSDIQAIPILKKC
jgi:hypothetical protein